MIVLRKKCKQYEGTTKIYLHLKFQSGKKLSQRDKIFIEKIDQTSKYATPAGVEQFSNLHFL